MNLVHAPSKMLWGCKRNREYVYVCPWSNFQKVCMSKKVKWRKVGSSILYYYLRKKRTHEFAYTCIFN